ncbi:MAG: magnesium transporter [Bacilli bacterium]|nr:magnesium transporter [Bacilli bacterium]MBQ6282726.1 magnesium transporter [Bacilli bacterium]
MEEKSIKELLEEKKLTEIKKILKDMNEYDIAELIEDLPENLLVQAFRLLPKNIAADVFSNMDEDVQVKLITALSSNEATNIIEDMYSDDAADLFEEMPAIMVKKILSNVSKDTRMSINRLLKYPDNSAGSLMAIEYIHLKKGLTVKECIDRIRKQKDDFVSYDSCFVTDNERKLLGYVTIKDLIISDMDSLVDDIMHECEHILTTMMDQEEVAGIFQDYDYSTLPVVDSEDRLVGIITIDDVIDILEEEATEDIEKMAAITPTDKPYMKTGIFETWKKRIPWLLLLMISATFTGKIISHFEEALATYVILTAFIPMLMDTGGNAGSQASVSIIRGLSLDEIEYKDTFKVITKELGVSILCGITLALANFIKLLLIDKVTLVVAFIVCFTLIITVIVAKLIGSSLPILAKKIGFDPAVMASPFITTIVDACSLLIYFKIAGLLLGI